MECKSKHEAQKLKLASGISVRTQQPDYLSAVKGRINHKKIISFKDIQKYREEFIKSKISIRTQRSEYPSALRDQKSIKRSISVANIHIYREIFIKSGIFVRILISIVSGRNIHQKKHHQQNASFCFLPKMRGFQKFIRLNIQRVIYVPGWKRCRAKKGGERWARCVPWWARCVPWSAVLRSMLGCCHCCGDVYRRNIKAIKGAPAVVLSPINIVWSPFLTSKVK